MDVEREEKRKVELLAQSVQPVEDGKAVAPSIHQPLERVPLWTPPLQQPHFSPSTFRSIIPRHFRPPSLLQPFLEGSLYPRASNFSPALTDKIRQTTNEKLPLALSFRRFFYVYKSITQNQKSYLVLWIADWTGWVMPLHDVFNANWIGR